MCESSALPSRLLLHFVLMALSWRGAGLTSVVIATRCPSSVWCLLNATKQDLINQGLLGNRGKFAETLQDVCHVHASAMAFIAVRSDRSLVSWGDFNSLRDSLFAKELRGVKQVQASDEAFAAILSDGSVVSWGQFRSGGDSTAVQTQLQDVKELHATRTAFAALRGDGSVVTWGHADGGGDSSAVQGQLKDVQELCATASAFVAFLIDGSVIVSGTSLVMCVVVFALEVC